MTMRAAVCGLIGCVSGNHWIAHSARILLVRCGVDCESLLSQLWFWLTKRLKLTPPNAAAYLQSFTHGGRSAEAVAALDAWVAGQNMAFNSTADTERNEDKTVASEAAAALQQAFAQLAGPTQQPHVR
jgi:hypothetical protein